MRFSVLHAKEGNDNYADRYSHSNPEHRFCSFFDRRCAGGAK